VVINNDVIIAAADRKEIPGIIPIPGIS